MVLMLIKYNGFTLGERVKLLDCNTLLCTDPDTATQEINDLFKLVEDAKSKYQGEDDFIVMGDLNADCQQLLVQNFQ
ncbi:MAG: hypothetical protein KKA10_14015 [Euryarchaeota archaeon]|nr:hypothetical protein [Euryarchaeota archaeon]MCG2738188.1 hypothetical protein [Candidatus Methanoperedenaceae archaeon]